MWETCGKTMGKWIKMDDLSDLTLIEVEKLVFWGGTCGIEPSENWSFTGKKRIYVTAFWLHRFC